MANTTTDDWMLMDTQVTIWPSIMCSKPWDFKAYIEAFEEVGVAGIHFDVMDGHYVPNVMLGTDDFDAMSSITSLPMDVHIMSDIPDTFVDFFRLRPGDRCSFHPEVSIQPYRLLEKIRALGCKSGLALSPGITVDYLRECLGVTDFVMVMAISPGFAGQKMVVDHLDKLRRIKEIADTADHPIEIIIDGNTTVPNARKMLATGATGLVVGTSSMMKEGPSGFIRLHNEYLKGICAED